MHGNIDQLKKRFQLHLWIAVAVAVCVFLFPVKPASPNNTFRLILTIVFFASGIYALAMLLHPSERFAIARMKQRYRDAPPQLELAS